MSSSLSSNTVLPPDNSHCIYIHGFRSSPKSMKAEILVEWFESIGRSSDLSVPKLHHSPKIAIEQLEAILAKQKGKKIYLVGSSLGGYYATWLVEHHPDVCGVLVNPGVTPDLDLEQYLGTNEVFYSGETFELLPEHIQEMKDLHIPNPGYPKNLMLMVQTDDETLDYHLAVQKFINSPTIIQYGGSHGFDDFKSMIPTIMNFAKQF